MTKVKPTPLAFFFLVAAILVVQSTSAAPKRDQEINRRPQTTNYEHLIWTGPTNYALTTSHLLQRHNAGWKTVSVNGNDVLFVSAECHYSIKQFDSLSDKDRAALSNAKGSLELNEKTDNLWPGGDQFHGFDCTYDLESGALLRASSFGELQLSYSRGQSGASAVQYGRGQFSLAGLSQDFASNLVRLFVDQQVASFVYRDGRVRMKPLACLQPSEARLIERTTAEANSIGQLEY